MYVKWRCWSWLDKSQPTCINSKPLGLHLPGPPAAAAAASAKILLSNKPTTAGEEKEKAKKGREQHLRTLGVTPAGLFFLFSLSFSLSISLPPPSDTAAAALFARVNVCTYMHLYMYVCTYVVYVLLGNRGYMNGPPWDGRRATLVRRNPPLREAATQGLSRTRAAKRGRLLLHRVFALSGLDRSCSLPPPPSPRVLLKAISATPSCSRFVCPTLWQCLTWGH
ncbi:hypothetical protein LY78DRAFT_489128 [Colletotrichum sublineola]|nr:hypothetical protein LY78DRAFT_489128 [Colletotrichum sublineola]